MKNRSRAIVSTAAAAALALAMGAGFILQHSGTMDRGEPRLSVTVVPDSGTGDLSGLAGTMAIDIADGVHSYTLEYTLPAKP